MWVRRVFRYVQIDTDPRRSSSVCIFQKKKTRSALQEDDGYIGVLLPYFEVYETPQELVDATDLEGHAHQTDGLAYCYQLIEDGTHQWDAIPHIEDAASQYPRHSWDGENQKLPRYLQFPPSAATGTGNPFARLPAENWFGDVYSHDT